MKDIHIKSPTRVDLAGGTLDLWPLYTFTQGAVTVNVSIDIFTYVDIQRLQDQTITIESQDLKFSKTYSHLLECLADQDPKVSLLQALIRYWKPTQGFILKTKSESPVGGGLGGSSSLIISLMKAFGELTGRPIKSAHELVHIAHNIEAAILNTPTGTQDYYPAISGGLHILKYSEAGIHQDTLKVSHSPLSKYFLLVNTGHSHHSGLNNFEVMKSAVAKNPATLEALYELKQIALEMEKACREEQWQLLPELFNREFKARVYLSPAFTSPEIEKLQKLTLSHGAEAVKICGAGGGGCVLVWVEPSCREKVVQACQQQGFSVLGAKPIDLI
jgi:D-glycero-alpha-D-manno-heptose-7-phosphate kinase